MKRKLHYAQILIELYQNPNGVDIFILYSKYGIEAEEILQFIDDAQKLSIVSEVENGLKLKLTNKGRNFVRKHYGSNSLVAPEVILILQNFTDQQLRDELKRRAEQRKANSEKVFRCRDCKHCINGYTTARASWRGETTAVCALKPKYKAGPDCHYSTSHSNRACVNFEPKDKEK